MDIPELPEGWEKKALIALGVLILILVIYAYNPFGGKSNVSVQNQNPETIVPVPFPQKNTNTSTNNSSIPGNATFKITVDQAKSIATKARPGYDVGQPIQGSVLVNNTNYNVWIVPLSKNNVVSKTIYIDGNTGIIVLEI